MDIAFGFQQFNLTIIFSFMLLQLNICSLFWICWRFLNTNFVNAHLYLTWIDQSEPSCARAGRYNSRSLRPIHRRDAILKARTDPNSSPSDWSEWSVASSAPSADFQQSHNIGSELLTRSEKYIRVSLGVGPPSSSSGVVCGAGFCLISAPIAQPSHKNWSWCEHCSTDTDF